MQTPTQSGGLEHLCFEAYVDARFERATGQVFEVMFNPATYTTRHAVEYDDEQAPGTTGLPQRYKRSRPTDFSLSFTLDGTGAAADRVNVDQRVADFLKTVHSYIGESHRPPYLKIIWGGLLMRCVFKTADVKYTLFAPDGSALRVEITATFTGAVDDERRSATERSSSPDLTHRHVVRQGESLPGLCHHYYGQFGPLIAVARFNRLAGLMQIASGQVIYFPPLERQR